MKPTVHGVAAFCGGKLPSSLEWAMRRNLLSQSYTTKLEQLWRINCS